MKKQATKKSLQCIRLFSAALVVMGAIFSLVGLAQTDWTLVTPPKPDNVSAIAVASNNSNRVFLATEHWGGWDIKQGVSGRDPNNFYWTNVTPPYGLYEVHLAKLLPAPNTPTTIYMMGTQGGSIALSPDDGVSWVDPLDKSVNTLCKSSATKCGGVGGTPPEKPLPALAIHPTIATSLLAGGKTGTAANSGGINQSTDCGCTWTVANNFPPAALTNITVVTDIKFVDSPTTNPPTNLVWAATANGPIYPVETPDCLNPPYCQPQPCTPTSCKPQGCAGVFRGTMDSSFKITWTQFTLPGNANCVYALAPVAGAPAPCQTAGKCLYAATGSGLYFTSNADAAMPMWTQQQITGIPITSTISNVVYASLPTPTVYIGTYIGNTSLDGIYMTTSIGNSLSKAPGFPASQNRVNALGARDGDSNTLYVAYDTGDISKGTYSASTFTVTPVQGAQGGYSMDTIAVPATPDGNTVYVATVCQGGIYKSTTGGGNWLQMTKPSSGLGTQDNHFHFHYVMRLAAHPNPDTTINPGYVYATDDDDFWSTPNGGGGSTPSTTTWTNQFAPTDPKSLQGIHLHGLAVAPDPTSVPATSTLYVGTGHGNWPDRTVNYLQVWRSDLGGLRDIMGNPTFYDVTCMKPDPKLGCALNDPTIFPQWTVANCDYSPANITNCTSLYTMAISPTDPNVVFVGTFGNENYPRGVPPPVSFGYPDPNQIMGVGHGVVQRWWDANGKNWVWKSINIGLCPDNMIQNCPASDPGQSSPNARSLWVGSVAIDNLTSPNVYIATLNGLYKRSVSADPTVAWQNITPLLAFDLPRFESIAIDPNDSNIIYAGTSETPGRAPRIFRSTNGGQGWGTAPMTFPTPNPMQPLAWATQYRVRDIKVTSATQAGQPKAYAVIEGSGIYRYNFSSTSAPQRPR